ncbi:MAG: hypothetical protein ACXQS3_05895 [Candidatus Methanofastidiosia archaeon]
MEIIEEVKERASVVPGIVCVKILTEEEKIKTRKLEKMAEENGAAGGLMDFVNEGVWAALDKEHVLLIVADNDQGFRDPPESWTLMVDEEKNVIGEWLPKNKIEEFKKKKNVHFIGDDFVLYTDRKRVGRSYFLLPAMPFPELESVKNIKNITSGSVSPPADMYLKKLTGITENYWTILVGFDKDD